MQKLVWFSANFQRCHPGKYLVRRKGNPTRMWITDIQDGNIPSVFANGDVIYKEYIELAGPIEVEEPPAVVTDCQSYNNSASIIKLTDENRILRDQLGKSETSLSLRIKQCDQLTTECNVKTGKITNLKERLEQIRTLSSG